MSAVLLVNARSSETFSGSSATVSATMSEAPARAFSGVSKPASSLTKAAASSSADPLADACMMIMFASGSRPASRAFWARVRRFLRKGLYRSSTRCSAAAPSIWDLSSSVSLPCPSMRAMTSCLRSSRLRR